MIRYNALLTVIRNSLIELRMAIQGLQVMSEKLDNMLTLVSIGKIPNEWISKSFPSLKPLSSYINELLDRLQMLQTWYDQGQPSAFWIFGFFFTPSFTTSILQNYARKHKLSIDKLDFDFEMMEMDHSIYVSPPKEGAYVYGLFLEGCGWNSTTKILIGSENKLLHLPAPVIWLKPQILEEMKEYHCYDCPVYRTADCKGTLVTTGHSTNFLMMIRMPSDSPKHHWVMRGVCMLCSLSE